MTLRLLLPLRLAWCDSARYAAPVTAVTRAPSLSFTRRTIRRVTSTASVAFPPPLHHSSHRCIYRCITTSDELQLCASPIEEAGGTRDAASGRDGVTFRPTALGRGLNLYVPAEYLFPAATFAYILFGFLAYFVFTRSEQHVTARNGS